MTTINTRRHHLITLGLLCFSFTVCLFAVFGCGYPKPIDPPLFTYPTEILTRLSAEARAKDIDGAVFYVLNTHSMEPLLRGGDYIVVLPKQRAPYADLKAGEVITYYASWYTKHPVTHRLVQKDKDGWILSGDANRYSESRWRVTENAYLGKVDGIYRTKP